MKDKRDELIPKQLSGYTWDMTDYAPKVPLSGGNGLTMREVRNAFQLMPEPPEMELNDYIREAVQQKNLVYFSFFLHRFEPHLNSRVYRFLTRSGLDRYDPARFLDYKLEVLQMLLLCLPRFDPGHETAFLKYANHYINNGLLFCRMTEEAGSFESLAEYRRVRHIGALYADSGKSCTEVISEFAGKAGYKEDGTTAEELLTIARRNRSIVPLYRTEQDEDSEATGEDVTCDDRWNYADILWNGIRATVVKRAFGEMEPWDQMLLEGRNAICMACGRVSPMSKQKSYEELATAFEGSTASGAERAYRRALDRLRLRLMESGIVHTVTLKQTERLKKGKKIAAAVYRYLADNDGEWGEIRFDFETGTAEIVRLADWDTMKSNVFAKTAIRYIQSLPEVRLLKSVVVPFEMEGPEKSVLPDKVPKSPEADALHTISLRQMECRKTNGTITTAVFQYQEDSDGEWGEIRFDFVSGKTDIVKLADWDTVKSNVCARAVIRYIHCLSGEQLPINAMFSVTESSSAGASSSTFE